MSAPPPRPPPPPPPPRMAIHTATISPATTTAATRGIRMRCNRTRASGLRQSLSARSLSRYSGRGRPFLPRQLHLHPVHLLRLRRRHRELDPLVLKRRPLGRD